MTAAAGLLWTAPCAAHNPAKRLIVSKASPFMVDNGISDSLVSRSSHILEAMIVSYF